MFISYIGEGRKESSLDKFWDELSEEQKQSIASVSVDMWKPFIQSINKNVSEAEGKIVHDHFHIAAYMNKAVDQVRKQEHTQLKRQGDESLKGTKYDWLYAKENRPNRTLERWEGLKHQSLKTSRSWSIKELFRDFWKCSDKEEATGFFKQWYNWAIRCRLSPVKKVAKMLKNHLQYIVNYFDHGTSNGPIEGINNKVQSLIKKSYGYRNVERLKTDIMFHLGGLNLYPDIHTNS